MSIPVRQAGRPSTGTFLLTVVGDVDLATAPAFGLLLEFATQASATVIVDFSDVRFMDCSGLPALLDAHALLGDRLELRGLRPAVQRLLRLTGVGPLLGLPDQLQRDQVSPDFVGGLAAVPDAATSDPQGSLVPVGGGTDPRPWGLRQQGPIVDRPPHLRRVPAVPRAGRP